MQAIQQSSPTNPRLIAVVEKINCLKGNGVDIVFCWIPSHIGLRGNEEANEAAQKALGLNDPDIMETASDLKSYISGLIYDEWQDQWSTLERNKLKNILPNLKEYHPRKPSARREVIITGSRIGHSDYTHSYLLKGEPPPFVWLAMKRLPSNIYYLNV